MNGTSIICFISYSKSWYWEYYCPSLTLLIRKGYVWCNKHPQNLHALTQQKSIACSRFMLHVDQTNSILVILGTRLTRGPPFWSCVPLNTTTTSLWRKKKVTKECPWTFHNLSLEEKQITDHISLAKAGCIDSLICKVTEALNPVLEPSSEVGILVNGTNANTQTPTVIS